MPNQMTLPTTQPKTGATLVSTTGKPYPLKAVTILARAESGLALTTLTQTYANPYEEPLEVHYTLPLPADGAVLGFTMTLGTRTITSEVHPAEEAARIYDRAIETGHAAALMQQHRADTFTQQLGNLPPGTEAKIEIHVLHPLAFILGREWEYRFPTVAGVRYHGEPGRVEDANKLDPDRADEHGTPVRARFALHVGDETKVEQDDLRLDRDIVARWRAVEADVAARVVEGRGLEGDAGRYALVTVTPPEEPKEVAPRDLTILIDASGSMSGRPLETAKEIAGKLVESLRDEDRFELLAFASEVRSIVGGPAAATATCRREAVAELRRLRAGGATEMTRAFVHALKPLREGAQRQIVLLTDGYIGFEAEVIGKVMAARDAGVRVHVAGIGAAPNRALTRGVSRAGAGIEVIADGELSPQDAAERILRATVGPVVTGLEFSGEAVLAVAPARGVDVLSGRPAVVAVRLRPEGGTFRIRGTRPGGTIWETERRVPPRGEATDGKAARVSELPIGALFGREAVADVEANMAAAGREEAARFSAEIEALGMRHRIATARTSLVAISEEPMVDPKAPRRRERLPVELPYGVSAEGVGFAATGAQAGMTMMAADASIVSRMAVAPRVFARKPRISFDRMDPSTVHELRGGYGPSTDSRRPHDRRYSIAARVLRCEGVLILLEFVCPEDGFGLPEPGQPVHVTLDGGGSITATAEDSGSTRSGPHARGLVLRLALVLKSDGDWASRTFELHWRRAAGPDGAREAGGFDEYTVMLRT